jgi:hypothetical protein
MKNGSLKLLNIYDASDKNNCLPVNLNIIINIFNIVDIITTDINLNIFSILLDNNQIINIDSNGNINKMEYTFNNKFCINKCTINTFKLLPQYFKNNMSIFLKSIRHSLNIKLPKFIVLFIGNYIC